MPRMRLGWLLWGMVIIGLHCPTPVLAQTYGIDFRNTLIPASGGGLGDSTVVNVASYWLGVGFPWHFDRRPTQQPRNGT